MIRTGVDKDLKVGSTFGNLKVVELETRCSRGSGTNIDEVIETLVYVMAIEMQGLEKESRS